MNTLRHSLRSLLAATALATPLLLGVMSNAMAAERKVLRGVATGNTVQRESIRQLQSGTVTSNTTRTGANGEVSTRTSTGVLDKEAGTWTRNATTTGANGKTATTSTEMIRTENGRSIDTTFTGPNGGTSTRATDVVRTDTGSERTTVLTGPNGRSATASTVVTRADNGATSNTLVTGPNGKTLTREGATRYDTETGTRTRSAATTLPNGNTTGFNSTALRTKDGYVRDATRTGTNGNTVTTHTVGSYDPDTSTATRSTTVTGPDGQTGSAITTRTFTPAP